MGQRTNIILQVRFNDKAWNKTTNETRVFYCQWGIGRILPKNVMSILHNVQSADILVEGAAKRLCPSGLSDTTDEWELKQDDLNALGFDNPKAVGEVMQMGNNNGGIFLRISQELDEEFHRHTTVEYAFMLGYEEGGKYKKFCTKEQFLKKQDQYIDDNFLKMLNITLDYYEAKDMAA